MSEEKSDKWDDQVSVNKAQAEFNSKAAEVLVGLSSLVKFLVDEHQRRAKGGSNDCE